MIQNMAVNALRILSADMIQNANSGHPGLPLGAAPMAYTLWARQMKHNPFNPSWINRDRFVLSAGHGSALLYSLLHLFGYGDLCIEDLKHFRQLHSLTPGHPEYGHTIGVEATTGPLGAGVGMGVGMAMAEAHMAAVFNRNHYKVFDNYTYVLCGDGCLMEGISSEALSLAGTLGLGKLIVLYDSNSITIEGSTDLAFDEDVLKRMEAFGFQTISVEDGNDVDAIDEAIKRAKEECSKPSFIKITTRIGYGVPEKEGSSAAHGEPLGVENVKILRKNLHWPLEEAFVVPNEVYDHYRELALKGRENENEWDRMFEEYSEHYPGLRVLLDSYYEDKTHPHFLDETFWKSKGEAEATRNISGEILNYLKEFYPNLIGGSADLAPSNKTKLKGGKDYSKADYSGRNIHFGVRELGMTAIANGMLLYGGLKVYAATFFVFVDYMKPMLRLSALMRLPLITVLTHDSIGVGEDGPTHEPIEQLTMLRSMPNINVFRPADETETKAAWYSAVNSVYTPTCIVLSRQKLPVLNNTSREALKGAYILEKEKNNIIDFIIISTGSELHLAVEAKRILDERGKSVRVISMPCMDVFEMQTEEYKEMVLPKDVVKRIVIEAGSSLSWGKYLGDKGLYITIDEFGESAPADQLFEKFGFSLQKIISRIDNFL